MSHAIVVGGLCSLFIIWGWGRGWTTLTLDFLSLPLCHLQDTFLLMTREAGGRGGGQSLTFICTVVFCKVFWNEEKATFLLIWSCL